MTKILSAKREKQMEKEIIDNEFHENLRKEIVGKNFEYYELNWSKYENEKFKTGWNWAAMILGPVWLAYRKMYSEAVILIIIANLLGLISSIFSLYSVSRIILILISITLGIWGDYYYYLKVEKKVKKMVLLDSSSNEYIKKLKKLSSVDVISSSLILITLLILKF